LMKTIPETKKMKTREKNVTSQALPTSSLSCDQLQIHCTDHMISNREVMSNISTWQILMLQVKFQTLQNIHQFSSKATFLSRPMQNSLWKGFDFDSNRKEQEKCICQNEKRCRRFICTILYKQIPHLFF